MRRPIPRFRPKLLNCAALLTCVLMLLCGLSAHASAPKPDVQQTEERTAQVPNTAEPLAIEPEELPAPSEESPAQPMTQELYPVDVQTVFTDGTRQIIRTYILTPEQTPTDIPRGGFSRDGWNYSLTEIIEKRTSGMETRNHTETVEINTDTHELNEIIKLLAPTMEYQSEDGYSGILALDLTSLNCEPAGYRNSSFTATATREYPHLSNADTSLIPKTITDNGRTLTLEGVSWEAQRYVNVDYEDVPESYRAIASYSANSSRRVVTGFITTAEYSGEIARTITGDTVYTAYFEGSEIDPAPKPMPTPEQAQTPEPVSEPESAESPAIIAPPQSSQRGSSAFPLILICLAALAAIAGAAASFMKRHNVKVYRNGFDRLVAKDKISTKNKLIDLSPLDSGCFGVEIDKYTAKSLTGQTVEIRHGTSSLKHKIAYEGNAYRIEADFGAGTVQAIY